MPLAVDLGNHLIRPYLLGRGGIGGGVPLNSREILVSAICKDPERKIPYRNYLLTRYEVTERIFQLVPVLLLMISPSAVYVEVNG